MASPLNYVFSCFFLASIGLYIFKNLQEKDLETKSVDIKTVGILTAFSIFITAINGVGGFSEQNFDYIFHNSKFYDLFAYPLPSYYPEANQFACYYFGYWLPVGLLSKLTGENSIALLSFVWTNIGVTIGLIWLYLLCKKSIFRVFSIFFMAGLLSTSLILITKPSAILISGYQPFTKAFLQFLPLISTLNWVPNQFIPALIGTCVLVYEVKVNKNIFRPFFIVISMIFWSPFSFLSVCFIYLFFLLSTRFSIIWEIIKKEFTIIIFTLISITPVLIYFLGNSSGQIQQGFIFEFEKEYWLVKWLMFIALEVWIFVFLVYKKDDSYNKLIIFSAILMSLMALVKWGLGNDFCVRAGVPLQIILFVVFSERLHDNFIKKRINLRSIIFVLMTFLPLKYFARGLYNFDITGYKKVNYHRYKTTYDAFLDTYTEKGATEMMLKDDSIFYKYFLDKRQKKVI